MVSMVVALLFGSSLLLTWFLSGSVREIMCRYGIVDHPVGERKIHQTAIPYGGGIAMFLAFFLSISIARLSGFFVSELSQMLIASLCLGGLILMIGGLFDDMYSLPARIQAVFPVLAAGVVFFLYNEQSPTLRVFDSIAGISPTMAVIAPLIFFGWLLTLMFTTKLLDGLDGLVTGVVGIGALLLFFVSQLPQWFDADISLLSILFFGVCLGFLLWNFHPAKMFLGEGGSLFAGFVLGTLALFGQTKIAITVLVLGVPLLDMLRVITLRILRKKSITSGDRAHLHFALLASGLSHRKTVLLFYFVSALLGVLALVVQNQKILAGIIGCIALVCIGLQWIFAKKEASRV